MHKKSTQTVIPFAPETESLNDIVRQHWNITFSRQGKMSVYSKRMMALVLGQIQRNDSQIKPYYTFKMKDLISAEEGAGGRAYGLIKKALDELARQVWSVEDIERKIYLPKQLINTSTMVKKDGFEYGLNDGLITIVLNPSLEPYFVAMSHYSSFEISNYMRFKSWYSMRIWEILSAFTDTGFWQTTIEEYRVLMDCEKKYQHNHKLIEKTIAVAKIELKNTPCEFTLEKIYGESHGKGRPPLIAFKFILSNKQHSPSEIVQSYKNNDEKSAKIINDLQTIWKIKDSVLAKYLTILEHAGCYKLMREWQIKEQSNRRIDNRERFCNAAFKKAALQIKNKDNE